MSTDQKHTTMIIRKYFEFNVNENIHPNYGTQLKHLAYRDKKNQRRQRAALSPDIGTKTLAENSIS